MPKVEEAVCMHDGQLIDESFSIEKARAIGRPRINPYEFHCYECGIQLSPVIGSNDKPLRHSPSYRTLPDVPHKAWCPHFNEADVRTISEAHDRQQYVASTRPAEFELPGEQPRSQPPGLRLESEKRERLEEVRAIKIKTRSLERLAQHYRSIRNAHADAELSIRGCPGSSYMTVFQRMSELTAADLAVSHLHVYVGQVGTVKELKNGYLIFFSTKGRRNGTDDLESNLRASVLIRHNIGPPQKLKSVLATLNREGKRILYALGRFHPGKTPGAFTLTPNNSQLLHAALLES